MLVIDENTKAEIKDPNLDLGKVTLSRLNVWYRYVIDSPGEYEEVVIAEYPETGGKDVQTIEISPEIGHWEMINEEHDVLPYKITLDTTGFLKESLTPDILDVGIYHRYTESELEEVRKRTEEMEEKQNAMNALPSRVDTVEETQDDIVLLLADIVGGAV